MKQLSFLEQVAIKPAPRLVYCADGNARFAEIAIRRGYIYGAQVPNTVYYKPEFCDQNWRKPDRVRYMAALAEHRPLYATVLDLERVTQLDEVLSWAEDAAQYTQNVIIIPKVAGVIDRLPREIAGARVVLGYSVPTKFAGTGVPVKDFSGWPVHLLGGNPFKQRALMHQLNVVQADGNYIQKAAIKNTVLYAGRWKKMNELQPDTNGDSIYRSFESSLLNWRLMIENPSTLYALRLAQEVDIDAIQRIARQYRRELGFVSRPALRESMARNTLVVACLGRELVGFVNYRARKDGVQVVYEIAVDKMHRGHGVGAMLLEYGVPKPIRLKCTAENPANAFYEHLGFALIETEPGRKQPLNVYHLERET